MTTRGRYDLIAGATVAAVGPSLLRRRMLATDDCPAPLPWDAIAAGLRAGPDITE